MAYFATSLSFLFENLNKPIVFTGSQIPLCEPYNDARRNLIMALIFASSFCTTSKDEVDRTGPISLATLYFPQEAKRSVVNKNINLIRPTFAPCDF